MSRLAGLGFGRLGEVGRERPVVWNDDTCFALDGLTADIDGAFLEADGIRRTREALAAGELPVLDADGLRVGAPVARPMAVICIGQNYAAHAAESGSEPPAEPIIFFKHPNTVVGPQDPVAVPPGAEQVDWEVELGVVIGRRARYVDSDEDALACVAGYVVSHDVSERHYQLQLSGGQWSKGKCAETFNPLGPVLVAADEVELRVGAIRVRSRGLLGRRGEAVAARELKGVAADSLVGLILVVRIDVPAGPDVAVAEALDELVELIGVVKLSDTLLGDAVLGGDHVDVLERFNSALNLGNLGRGWAR